MATRPTDASMPFLGVGKEQTEAMLRMQSGLFDTYGETSRAWLARVKSEVDLWSQLASKLAAIRSAPEALGIYQECVTHRMQMAAEDAQRISDDCQKIMQNVMRSMPNGFPTARI